MERNEMIETLIGKTNVSREEAQEVLEKCNWDLLDSIIYLERRGKAKNNETTAIIEVKEEKQEKKEDNKKHNEKFGGIGEVIGRIFKFVGNTIKKANNHFVEVRKEDEKPIRISLAISILLLIFLSVPSIVLLIAGLLCGYKYSISGSNVSYDGVNNIFEKVSKSADTIKKNFKEGYER
ncbi:DUF4342 domain-containing protein [Terrisporobacter mayombei]|uniref:DUF4342 domain-containing protein n=1 Tax=Terrisporobacter mayombei TaxID=1541 RepID=A0ABY9PYS1_9FIRM|nr:DUF4342 domain-containing protein [Terrisporobacter mayombei]MCC3868018.1 DUF4342 domain-containing protein [Terrisporobacter mayombei]WMT80154.1 hypothetical protein TEMA_04670 [Terrisporobacter mayombei]